MIASAPPADAAALTTAVFDQFVMPAGSKLSFSL
jgi:hypothetical protein